MLLLPRKDMALSLESKKSPKCKYVLTWAITLWVVTSDEIWFGESGGGRGDGNKGPAVSEQHSSPGRDFKIFSNMIKYSNIQILSNIIKEAAVSGQHSSPVRDCQIFSNMIKYSNIQIFKHYQRSGSLWVTLITCEGLSNIFWGACEDKSN